jgi:DNA-binding NarL/FixJ family response regulator
MPGMSGFELLSIVRRRFPRIRVIAMSGAFSVDEIPRGLAADSFYEKGPKLSQLLQIVQAMTSEQRSPALHHRPPAHMENCTELARRFRSAYPDRSGMHFDKEDLSSDERHAASRARRRGKALGGAKPYRPSTEVNICI